MAIPYVTAEGMDLIKQEFNYIWNTFRPDVAQKLSWAASLGDRSENADYQYNKRLLREIDIRVKQISDILDKVKVLDRSADGVRDNKIYFGAYVELINDDNVVKHVRIVGSSETYSRNGYISMDSPMAKGLLNLTIDDEATIITPKGKVIWYINKISYVLEDWYGEVGVPVFKFDPNNAKATKILTEDELKRIKLDYLAHLAN